MSGGGRKGIVNGIVNGDPNLELVVMGKKNRLLADLLHSKANGSAQCVRFL